MSRTERTIDRRTVLRSAGATIGAAVAGTGLAAASHLQVGDCAVTKYESMAYDRACPTGSSYTYLDGGVEGQVFGTCTDDGTEWVHFSPGITIRPTYWVRASSLASC